jgi:hypothetical protein
VSTGLASPNILADVFFSVGGFSDAGAFSTSGGFVRGFKANLGLSAGGSKEINTTVLEG